MKDLGALISQAGIPDLAPVDGADFEWWFLQGWIEGEDVARTHVMASVFQIGAIDPGAPRGAMMIQHLLTPSTGATWVDSRVTPATTTAYRSVAEKFAEKIPRAARAAALKRHLRDTDTWARLSGIAVDRGGPRFSANPFALVWNGFSLAQAGDGLHAEIPLDGARALGLDLAATTHWLNERSTGLNPALSDHFFYVSCPRLAATGNLDDKQVTGQFWFDRQWGTYNDWILKGETGQGRVQGWNWFGLNLDDGRDLMLFDVVDSTAQSPRFATGVVYENGVPRLVDWRPGRIHRYWTSPQSLARYPVEWQIELPGLGINARVVPLTDAQEIPVYGPTAIWEGAVAVHGEENGQPIGGHGRLELVGYGTPLSMQDFARRSVGRFARNLSGVLNLGGN